MFTRLGHSWYVYIFFISFTECDTVNIYYRSDMRWFTIISRDIQNGGAIVFWVKMRDNSRERERKREIERIIRISSFAVHPNVDCCEKETILSFTSQIWTVTSVSNCISPLRLHSRESATTSDLAIEWPFRTPLFMFMFIVQIDRLHVYRFRNMPFICSLEHFFSRCKPFFISSVNKQQHKHVKSGFCCS